MKERLIQLKDALTTSAGCLFLISALYLAAMKIFNMSDYFSIEKYCWIIAIISVFALFWFTGKVPKSPEDIEKLYKESKELNNG